MNKPYILQHLQPTLVSEVVQKQLLAEWEHQGTSSEVTLGTTASSFATLLASGYLSPFTGFMHAQDALSVAENMRTSRGVFFPIPLIHLTPEKPAVNNQQLLLLRDPNRNGNPPLGVQRVEAIETLTSEQIQTMIRHIFGTDDTNHPGVATFLKQGTHLISGPIHCFNLSYYPSQFPDTFRTASQLRSAIKERGWKRVVAFQTRNPMHRAHEELCKMAMRDTNADGLIIHMLLGTLKAGDIPASVRDKAIRAVCDNYFEPNSVIIAGYGFDMLYAGPREALLHAIMRQNLGASHLIVGRDHAGVGDYYEPFEAQTIFDTPLNQTTHADTPADRLDINIYRADHTAWSKKLNQVVMMKDVPDHTPEDFILLSGTKVRAMLSEGTPLPEEFTRPEVATILQAHYQSKQ